MIRVEGSMKRTEKCLPGKKVGGGVGHDNVIFLSGGEVLITIDNGGGEGVKISEILIT